MKIVILGYTGLIGKNILKILKKKTIFNLICVGRDIEYKPYASSRIEYIEWNFTSFNKSKLLFLKDVNIIINCVGKSEDNIYGLEYINTIFVKKLIKHIFKYESKIRLIHLSSVAVYGAKRYFGYNKIISEDSPCNPDDVYSKTKLKGDLLIKNMFKKNLKKKFSYTILRISNVFGGEKKSNLFRFTIFSLKFGFWFKIFKDTKFNFVHIKDLAQVIVLIFSDLNTSKNKTYIVSDDCEQQKLYEVYRKLKKKKIMNIKFSFSFLKFLTNYVPLPKKLLNFILIISSRISYDNKKIKKELKYDPRHSIYKYIKIKTTE